MSMHLDDLFRSALPSLGSCCNILAAATQEIQIETSSLIRDGGEHKSFGFMYTQIRKSLQDGNAAISGTKFPNVGPVCFDVPCFLMCLLFPKASFCQIAWSLQSPGFNLTFIKRSHADSPYFKIRYLGSRKQEGCIRT